MLDDFDEYEDAAYEDEILIGIVVIAQTDKAVMIQHKNRTAWFPKAVIGIIDGDTMEYDGSFGPEWAANKQTAIEGDFI